MDFDYKFALNHIHTTTFVALLLLSLFLSFTIAEISASRKRTRKSCHYSFVYIFLLRTTHSAHSLLFLLNIAHALIALIAHLLTNINYIARYQ